MPGVLAVVQVLAVFEWYSLKSQQEGLNLDLLKVPMGQWGAFFLLVFLGQVQEASPSLIRLQAVGDLDRRLVISCPLVMYAKLLTVVVQPLMAILCIICRF